uniref:Uncharacterized protein n=1 Tax=Percolomonas cosmopolitus TaxID=63605 RepID=A0A7S1PJQ0_9EUKA
MREWLSKNQDRSPTREEVRQLSRRLGLGTLRIRSFINACRETYLRGELTEDKLQHIREWIDEHWSNQTESEQSLTVPTTQKLRQLSKDVSLSPRQVQRLVNRVLNPPGKLTQENQQIIQQYFEENHPNMHLKHDIDGLRKETGLNATQITNMIHRLKYDEQARIRKLTPELREIVLEWVENHPSGFVSEALEEDGARNQNEVDILVEMTGHALSRSQLHNLLWRLRKDKPQEMTQTKKNQTRQWLQEHDWRRPNKQELSELCDSIGLSRSQMRGLVHRLSLRRKND